MRKAGEAIGAFLDKIGFPLLLMSAGLLHLFTTITAFNLVDSGGWRYGAAVAAFAFPLISQVIVAFYAWRETGSMVNAYSVWLLVWLLLLFIVLGLVSMRNRYARGDQSNRLST